MSIKDTLKKEAGEILEQAEELIEAKAKEAIEQAKQQLNENSTI